MNTTTAPRRKVQRRHPALVTSDRLAEHLDRYFDKTDGPMRDAISRVRSWLEDRADESGARW